MTANQASAQCPTGEVEVTIDISTDNYGYEIYWQLLPNGVPCGTGAIFMGGNPLVGCNGAGAQTQNPGGYGNNLTITEGPWCLTENAQYDIFWADDWGDGGFNAEVFVDGTSIMQIVGGTGNPGETFTFTAAPPATRDMTVTRLDAMKYSFQGESVAVKGKLKSLGLNTVTDFDLNYTINSGSTVTQNITGVSLNAGDEYAFDHSTPWVSGSSGLFTLDVWASNINGQADPNPSNDNLQMDLTVSDAIPNIVDDYLTNSPIINVIANSNEDILVPRDLDFHPEMSRRELWIINKDTENSGGSTVTFFDVGNPGQTHQWKRDGNAWHFMSLPTGAAMGRNGLWATSNGVFDANHNGAPPFTGPTLWESDMSIYAEPSGGNGSHMDMLHESPHGQGIAHEDGNAYWVVDGFNQDVVRYDFMDDHGPGQHYHGDAIVHRYSDFSITRDPNDHIASHCIYDRSDGMLYVVDHGGQRIMRINTLTGSLGGTPSFASGESLTEYLHVINYSWSEIISTGLIEPSGIELLGDRLLVSDHSNGEIIIYDISDPNTTPELGRIVTNSPGIMGIKIGPDGFIWAVNASTHELIQITQGPVSVQEMASAPSWNIVPNPAQEMIRVNGLEVDGDVNFVVLDHRGRVALQSVIGSISNQVEINDLANGSYIVQLSADGINLGQRKLMIAR